MKELGVKCVVVRADREKQVKFLKKIGADDVIHTEMDMAHRTAMRFSARHVFEHYEMTPKYVVFEMEPPEAWVGRTVAEAYVRRKYQVNILDVKNGEKIEPILKPGYRFTKGTHLLTAGDKDDAVRLMDKQT